MEVIVFSSRNVNISCFFTVASAQTSLRNWKACIGWNDSASVIRSHITLQMFQSCQRVGSIVDVPNVLERLTISHQVFVFCILQFCIYCTSIFRRSKQTKVIHLLQHWHAYIGLFSLFYVFNRRSLIAGTFDLTFLFKISKCSSYHKEKNLIFPKRLKLEVVDILHVLLIINIPQSWVI